MTSPEPKYISRVGPGSPAWNAFDNALEAWLATPSGQHDRGNRSYKRYSNCRHYMIQCLKRAGVPPAVIDEWTALLRRRCRDDLADIEAYEAAQAFSRNLTP